MIPNYDFKSVEPEILKFWIKNNIYEKAKTKNKGGQKFYFLDGPPYTSGTVHIGTAWNKALKDVILRYKRMRGFDVWDRAGYDMHGLPTENKVREKFGVFFKPDIEKFGIDKFNTECEKFAVNMMHKMTEQFERLGVWMDFENAYTPITKGFIEGQWLLAKKAHEKNRLYEGLRAMPWCPNCQTTLAKHDLEYASVKEDSIYVKLKIKGKENEYLVIWTTTPWTIPFNLAVMVNPELEYVRVKVNSEVWILAKALANAIVQGIAGVTPKIVEEFKGAELEGIEYEHPFADVLPQYKELRQKMPKVHTVLLSSEYVDVSAGSGLVHCAPGCGPEDYEVGHRNNIEPWNVIDERGVFPEEMGSFAGLVAKKDDKKFVEALEERNAIIAVTPVEHDYGHCQRCHNPIIFRTTKQWFFKVEDLKDKMIEANNKILWVPKAAYNAFDSWLKNLRDNSITRQNFWGTPVPVWQCSDCGKYEVISTFAELEKKSGKKVEKFHRPWIDEHEIPCDCGKQKKRIVDVFDVWVDAGTVSWNCLDYAENKELFDKWFPADFILEGKDQIRGWFNMLMIAGFLAFDRPSFKAVYMHGFVQDALGRKMSKSLGNYIEPSEVVDAYGADTFRYYVIGGTNPGIDLHYNHADAKLKHKNLIILWNVHKYLIELAEQLKTNPARLKPENVEPLFGIEEKYVISRLHSTIKKATQHFDKYEINETPHVLEQLCFDLSRNYVQFVRDKASVGTENEKQAVLYATYSVVRELLKMLAPLVPFITERMHQDLKEKFGLPEESIHLCEWPVVDEKKIDEKLEKEMSVANDVIAAILAGREKARITVRWPVKQAIVVSQKKEVREAVERLSDIIKVQTNTKSVVCVEELPEVRLSVKADAGSVGKAFGKLAPQIIARLNEASPKAVVQSLADKGKFVLKTDQATVELLPEHVRVERELPEHLVEGVFKNGFAYVDTTRTKELEAEGFARELMRRVQALRKRAGLQKTDRIELFVHCDQEFADLLKEWVVRVKEKVGADNVVFSPEKPKQEYAHKSSEKTKKYEFDLRLNKI